MLTSSLIGGMMSDVCISMESITGEKRTFHFGLGLYARSH